MNGSPGSAVSRIPGLGYVGLASMLMLIVLGLGRSKAIYAHLYVENGIVETATAVLYAMAAGLALLRLRTAAGAGTAPLLVGLAAANILACLDEISFGLPWLGIPKPLVCGVRVDGCHDLLAILLKHTGGAGRMAALALGGAAAMIPFWLWRSGQRGCIAYGVLGVLLAGVAQLLDLHLLHLPHDLAWEENLELLAALAMVCAVRQVEPNSGAGLLAPARQWRQAA